MQEVNNMTRILAKKIWMNADEITYYSVIGMPKLPTSIEV